MRFADRFDRSKRQPSTFRQRTGFAFFWLIVLCHAYFISSAPNFNTESHLYLAFALVDHHTVQIDAYHQRLGDESQRLGHYYSDKAPGLSFLAVPIYAGLRLVLPSKKGEGYIVSGKHKYTIPRNTAYIRYAITYALVILPSAIFAVLLWLFLCRFLTVGRALGLSAVYSLGTIAFPYSVWFFSHQIAAMLLFGSFLILFDQVRLGSESRGSLKLVLLAGLLAGYAVICEYPTAVIAAGLGIYILAISTSKVKQAAAFVAGMVPPAALAIGYNIAAFGKALASGYNYVNSDLYHNNVHGGVLGLGNPASYGVQAPTASSLWEITFGTYRGIFLLTPVLLLFFAGLAFMWKRRDLRAEWLLCAVIVVLYFLIDASRGVDQNGWSGGWSVASRHLTPVLPFMILPIAFGISNKTFRALFLILGAVSVATMFTTVWTGSGGGYDFNDHNPLVHELLPHLLHGKVEVNWGWLLYLMGIPSLLPLVVLGSALTARITWLLRVRPNDVRTEPTSELKLEAS